MWYKYPPTLLTALVMLLTGAVGCSKPEKKTAETRLQVVCTFLPVYVMTQNVVLGTPGVYVRSLLPPAVGCPHHYSLTPTQQALLEEADILIMNGLGLEGFLQRNPAWRRSGLKIIDAGQAVDSLFGGEPEHNHPPQSAENSNHVAPLDASVNPHAWVSPQEATKMTRFIARQLGQADPSYASYYLANAERYAAHLSALSKSIKEIVNQAPNKRIVTFHHAFDYLAREVGLEIVGVIESVPGSVPSARDLAELIEDLRLSQPAAIFAEPQYSDRLARTLSEATGILLLILDPAASGELDPNLYLHVMEANLSVLQKALLPHTAPKPR